MTSPSQLCRGPVASITVAPPRAGETFIASGAVVHLVLPVLGCVSYVPDEGLDDADDNHDWAHEGEDTAPRQLMEDCRKCVYTTSLAHSQLVVDRMQRLAQQKVSARTCMAG
jgi:hypothetical protein